MSRKFFDIGVNATDTQFQGIYRGKKRHESDFELVHQRSVDANCSHWLITGGDLNDAKEALAMARHNDHWYSTAGIHPTRSNMMMEDPAGPEEYLSKLHEVITKGQRDGKIKAFGEFGLDYDRLDWSSKEMQIPVFEAQLKLAVKVQLPLFLHSRACEQDFLSMLMPYNDQLPLRGVVHSFTGSINEMQRLTEQQWSIGINGCSLKTEENLAVVKEIPLDLLMLETDAPWCDIRPSHAGHKYLALDGAPSTPESKKLERFESGKMIRSRNEPCTIAHVAWIVAQVKGIAYEEVVRHVFDNTIKMFG